VADTVAIIAADVTSFRQSCQFPAHAAAPGIKVFASLPNRPKLLIQVTSAGGLLKCQYIWMESSVPEVTAYAGRTTQMSSKHLPPVGGTYVRDHYSR
jgi:hypothetical protein